MFDAVFILSMLNDHNVTWDKAFSRFSADFGVFERIIYIERTEITSPFFTVKPVEGYKSTDKV